jgi:hypothetical protein
MRMKIWRKIFQCESEFAKRIIYCAKVKFLMYLGIFNTFKSILNQSQYLICTIMSSLLLMILSSLLERKTFVGTLEYNIIRIITIVVTPQNYSLNRAQKVGKQISVYGKNKRARE